MVKLMERSNESEGKNHFDIVKNNIPPQYREVVKDIEYKKNGRVYERMLEKILKSSIPIDRPTAPLFVIERNRKSGGYLQPDFQLKGREVFIEVTTWGDSNMIFSKIMQGFLLKKKKLEEDLQARYYVVIADLHISENWTYSADIDLWNRWGEIENIKAVDGWYGFKNIDKLIDEIKA